MDLFKIINMMVKGVYRAVSFQVKASGTKGRTEDGAKKDMSRKL